VTPASIFVRCLASIYDFPAHMPCSNAGCALIERHNDFVERAVIPLAAEYAPNDIPSELLPRLYVRWSFGMDSV